MSCEINFKETAVQRRSQRPNSGNHPAPPSLPSQRLQTLMLCQALWTSVFSELVSLLRLGAFRYGGRGLTGRSAEAAATLQNHLFSYLFPYKCGSGFDFQRQLAGRRRANIPLWFSASGPVHHGGFPCQINITRVIHWHHRLGQLGPGKVPTITLYLWYC